MKKYFKNQLCSYEDTQIRRYRDYEDTLNKSAYIDKSVYHALSVSNQANKNKHCQRNGIWFNPPDSKSVTTRIGQSFLYLKKHLFPKKDTPSTSYSIEIKFFCHLLNNEEKTLKNQQYYNNITLANNCGKLSNSSMENIKTIISNHNMNIHNPK